MCSCSCVMKRNGFWIEWQDGGGDRGYVQGISVISSCVCVCVCLESYVQWMVSAVI